MIDGEQARNGAVTAGGENLLGKAKGLGLYWSSLQGAKRDPPAGEAREFIFIQKNADIRITIPGERCKLSWPAGQKSGGNKNWIQKQRKRYENEELNRLPLLSTFFKRCFF